MSRIDTWLPLYVGDYLADTMHLEAREHGAYLLLIMHYWSTGPLPDEDRFLAGIARVDRKTWAEDTAAIVRPFFEPRDGKLYHKRIDAERARAMELSDKRRVAAGQRLTRSGGRKPGESGGENQPHANSNSTAIAVGLLLEHQQLAVAALNSRHAEMCETIGNVVRSHECDALEGSLYPSEQQTNSKPTAIAELLLPHARAGLPSPSQREERKSDSSNQTPSTEAVDDLLAEVAPPKAKPAGRQSKAAAADPEFAAFYAAYPRKTGPDAAARAWRAAVKRASVEEIMAGLAQFQFGVDNRYTPHPASWLNAGRWADEPLPSAQVVAFPRQDPADPYGLKAWVAAHPEDFIEDGITGGGRDMCLKGGLFGVVGALHVMERSPWPPTWRGDLAPLWAWSADQYAPEDIADAIQTQSDRMDAAGNPARSLRVFDAEVRAKPTIRDRFYINLRGKKA